MQRTITLPDDLVARIEGTATQQGKSVDAWLEQILRSSLDDQGWEELLAYGHQKGCDSGYTEADIPTVIAAWRREQRSLSEKRHP